jgi:GT2 family glycosyltransferase
VDKAATPIVTVAIVAYQAGEFLQRCVDSLAAQTFTGFEAIILDNASTDGSINQLDLPDERFRIERLGKNLGFAAANNRERCHVDRAQQPRRAENLSLVRVAGSGSAAPPAPSEPSRVPHITGAIEKVWMLEA